MAEKEVSMITRYTTRKEIIDRVRHQRDKINQYFVDVAIYNEKYRFGSEPPIDPDPDGQLGRLLESLEKCLESERQRGLMI